MTYTIGIDVGGTKVLGGVVDESGVVIAIARKDTPRQGGAALTQVIEIITPLSSTTPPSTFVPPTSIPIV